MDKDLSSAEEYSHFSLSGLRPVVSHIAAYPRHFFSTLIWLRHEHEALALAELVENPAVRGNTLCVIARSWRERGDADPQEMLQLLAQAQECLASQKRGQANLVRELVAWQQWQPAQEIAQTLGESIERNRAFLFIFQAKLQAGMWEEALAVAHSAGNASHGWMLRELCGAYARVQDWDKAEEIARLIEQSSAKVEALSVLACELTVAAENAHAEMLWKQAIQVSNEGEVNFHVLGALSEVLARAQQWEMAESVARALIFPRAGAQNDPVDSRSDRKGRDEIDAGWTLVERCSAFARLACECTKAQQWERAVALWEEARAAASASKDILYQVKALEQLALCLGEAQLWEMALDTWQQTEILWQERKRQERADLIARGEASLIAAYEDEGEMEREQALLPFCRYLVNAQRWKQAWILCQPIEPAYRITLGGMIAAALEQLQQRVDAQIIWEQTCELALSSYLTVHDLAELASVLQQNKRLDQADAIWKAAVQSMLEKDSDEVHRRNQCATNYAYLALALARTQRREESRRLLQECVQAIAREMEDSE